MKITKSDYLKLKYDIESGLRFASKISELRKRGVSEMRIRWDLFHRFNNNPKLYDYLNDSHIDTALKQIIKETK